MSIFELPKNYSGHAIMGAFAIAQLAGSRWTAVALGIDHNVMPRNDIMRAETQKKISPGQLAFVQRMSAAHYNGLENLAFFYGPLLLANLAKLPVADINSFCVKYLALRLFYTVVYFVNTRELFAPIRTVTWWWAMLLCLNMSIRAGAAL